MCIVVVAPLVAPPLKPGAHPQGKGFLLQPPYHIQRVTRNKPVCLVALPAYRWENFICFLGHIVLATVLLESTNVSRETVLLCVSQATTGHRGRAKSEGTFSREVVQKASSPGFGAAGVYVPRRLRYHRGLLVAYYYYYYYY